MAAQTKQSKQKSKNERGTVLYQGILFSSIFLLGLALLTFNHQDHSVLFDTTELQPSTNWLGSIGAQCAALLLYFFGCSAWLILCILAYCLRILLFGLTWRREIDRIVALSLLVFTASTIAELYNFELYTGINPGGWFGALATSWLSLIFKQAHKELFLLVTTWALLIVVVRFSFIIYLYPLAQLLRTIPIARLFYSIKSYVMRSAALRKANAETSESIEQQREQVAFDTLQQKPAWVEMTPAYPSDTFEIEDAAEEPHLENGPYRLPPLSLFPSFKEQPVEKGVQADNEQQARTLEHKLERFNIKGKVISITQGPAVTLFEYQPSIDTKISTILAREDDLALALQAMSLRIIAPIPGRSVIGFEVAHHKRRPVLFSQALRSSAFSGFTGSLPLILGKDTLGQDIVIDLAAMPHLLVAGSTGSGKSVGLHTMIMSLLCSKTPDEVKFILIDPKRLEFTAYADMAHLIFPIVTDPRRAISVLKWAVETMEDRYALMAQAAVRNCIEFNSRSKPGDEQYLPLIVIIIDELADLMMTAGKDVETYIARLAQMARAAGIHLIAATQRPSVDVITGLIKVNFPSRIAYKVTSKVDSRTILDMMGAEKLLGKGDMLFLDGKGMVSRVHGAYVTDAEISAVAGHIKTQRAVEYKELTILRTEEPAEESDELFQEVIHYIKNKDEVSISLIQRVFRIGYNRSARIIDQLESFGYILPADGSKMRKVTKDA